jgi:hypothetical protein
MFVKNLSEVKAPVWIISYSLRRHTTLPRHTLPLDTVINSIYFVILTLKYKGKQIM